MKLSHFIIIAVALIIGFYIGRNTGPKPKGFLESQYTTMGPSWWEKAGDPDTWRTGYSSVPTHNAMQQQDGWRRVGAMWTQNGQELHCAPSADGFKNTLSYYKGQYRRHLFLKEVEELKNKYKL